MHIKWPLTPAQKRYKGAIKWLVSTYPRAAGRSLLLAISMIEVAIEEGHEVMVFDHFPTHDAARRQLQLIQKIIHDTQLDRMYEWSFRTTSFMCVRKRVPAKKLLSREGLRYFGEVPL